MVRREKMQALVLSRRSVGEADRLVTLFTREQGLLRVLAKGVRKIPSRRGGHMESLTQVLVLVAGSEGRYFLQAVETQDYFSDLHGDREALERMLRLARVVVGLFEEGTAYPRLFDALRQACEMLPGLPYVKRSLLEVAVVVLALREGGVLPLLGRCQRCGGRQPEEAVVLDSAKGGWVCLTCLPVRLPAGRQGQAGRSNWAQARVSLTPRMLVALRYLASYPNKALRLSVSEEEARQLVEAVRRYVLSVTMHEAAA